MNTIHYIGEHKKEREVLVVSPPVRPEAYPGDFYGWWVKKNDYKGITGNDTICIFKLKSIKQKS